MSVVVVCFGAEVHEIFPGDEVQVGEVRMEHVDPSVHEADRDPLSGQAPCVQVARAGHCEGPIGPGHMRTEERDGIHKARGTQAREGAHHQNGGEDGGPVRPGPAPIELPRKAPPR